MKGIENQSIIIYEFTCNILRVAGVVKNKNNLHNGKIFGTLIHDNILKNEIENQQSIIKNIYV